VLVPPPALARAAMSAPPEGRLRLPITAVAVFGLGALMAVAVGLELFLGLRAAARNTSDLLQARSTTLVNVLEAKLDAMLSPVVLQAHWIAERVAEGSLDPARHSQLDSFMSGALSATPQVAGIGLVDPQALIRRWGRENGGVVWEDWSNRPEITAWLAAIDPRAGPAWRRPVWTHTTGTTVVMHEMPLRRDGRLLGVLVQVVPATTLSRTLAEIRRDTGITPFVLLGDERVLAHPDLALDAPVATGRAEPLPAVSAVADPTLLRLDSPDEVPRFLRGLTGLRAGGVVVDERYRVLLHREVTRYGPVPWTVGVHFDAELEAGSVTRRLGLAIEVGVALCLLAIGIAVLAGRRLARPVQLLARAAEAVRADRLGEVPPLPGSWVRELDTALRAFREMVAGLRERQVMRDVLGRFVPESVARELLAGDGSLPAQEVEATLLFCDLEGFTALTERMGPSGILQLLNEYFEAMVRILERHGGIVTQFQGDAILATFNVPLADPEHAAGALRAALEMQDAVRTLRFAGERLGCRIGINTGPVVAGAVGAKGRLSYTVHGDAVNLAARLEAMNKDFGTSVLVSAETALRVQGFRLRPVGEASVRGQTRPARVFELVGARDDA
jgi:class 3 adenylate cyclase